MASTRTYGSTPPGPGRPAARLRVQQLSAALLIVAAALLVAVALVSSRGTQRVAALQLAAGGHPDDHWDTWAVGQRHEDWVEPLFKRITARSPILASTMLEAFDPEIEVPQGTACTVEDTAQDGCWIFGVPGYENIKLFSSSGKDMRGNQYTKMDAQQWAVVMQGMIKDLAKLPSGKRLLEKINDATPQVRMLGVKMYTPKPLKGKGINLLITRGPKCEGQQTATGGKHRKTRSGAGATDNDAKVDGRGSDTGLNMDTCGYAAGETPFDILAHEMIHNLHHLQGIGDSCRCCEELRTVGIQPRLVGKSTDHITENALREERGNALKKRIAPRTTYPTCEATDMSQLCSSVAGSKCTTNMNAGSPGWWTKNWGMCYANDARCEKLGIRNNLCGECIELKFKACDKDSGEDKLEKLCTSNSECAPGKCIQKKGFRLQNPHGLRWRGASFDPETKYRTTGGLPDSSVVVPNACRLAKLDSAAPAADWKPDKYNPSNYSVACISDNYPLKPPLSILDPTTPIAPQDPGCTEDKASTATLMKPPTGPIWMSNCPRNGCTRCVNAHKWTRFMTAFTFSTGRSKKLGECAEDYTLAHPWTRLDCLEGELKT